MTELPPLTRGSTLLQCQIIPTRRYGNETVEMSAKECASMQRKVDQTLIPGLAVKLSRPMLAAAEALAGVMDGTTSRVGMNHLGTVLVGASRPDWRSSRIG